MKSPKGTELKVIQLLIEAIDSRIPGLGYENIEPLKDYDFSTYITTPITDVSFIVSNKFDHSGKSSKYIRGLDLSVQEMSTLIHVSFEGENGVWTGSVIELIESILNIFENPIGDLTLRSIFSFFETRSYDPPVDTVLMNLFKDKIEFNYMYLFLAIEQEKEITQDNDLFPFVIKMKEYKIEKKRNVAIEYIIPLSQENLIKLSEGKISSFIVEKYVYDNAGNKLFGILYK